MKAVAVIPARYASTRLPGKPLADIAGKPMIQRVCELARQARGLADVIVATDDTRVLDAVTGFGATAMMTSSACACGTERVREVARRVPADVYVNIQGDEPLLEPSAIERLLAAFDDPQVRVATLCAAIDARQAASPSQVKVVLDHRGDALYFSRALIPWPRDGEPDPAAASYLGHIGVYAYRADTLAAYPDLPASPLEEREKLEQLRLLQAGVPIRVVEVPAMGPGVDTPEDLERVRGIFRARRRARAIEQLRGIRLVITDVDGVLTDGGLIYGEHGETLKRFCASDGLGFILLRKAGVRVAVLSGRDCAALRSRVHDLGITEAVLGRLDKAAAIGDLMERCGVAPSQVAVIGDDLPDAELFGMVGVGVAVANAPDYVQARADLVLATRGGEGAFRELADYILGLRPA